VPTADAHRHSRRTTAAHRRRERGDICDGSSTPTT
jgi:hypothetical protein